MNDPSKSIVSVVVITYNSAKYVLETLESAKNQSYDCIELVISDDGSKDDTVDICRKWLVENGSRFVRTNLLTVKENTGIAANCNRGVLGSNGYWLKLIAGDDVLMDSCISDYMTYIDANLDVHCAHSNFYWFNDNQGMKELNALDKSFEYFSTPEVSVSDQLKLIYRDNFISAPTLIFSRFLYDLVNGFDENLPYDDWPFFIKILESKNRIHFVPVFSVLYRVHGASIYNNGNGLFNGFYKLDRVVYLKCRKRNLSFFEVINEDFYYFVKIGFDAVRLNRKGRLTELIFLFFSKFYTYNKIVFRYFFLKRWKE